MIHQKKVEKKKILRSLFLNRLEEFKGMTFLLHFKRSNG